MRQRELFDSWVLPHFMLFTSSFGDTCTVGFYDDTWLGLLFFLPFPFPLSRFFLVAIVLVHEEMRPLPGASWKLANGDLIRGFDTQGLCMN